MDCVGLLLEGGKRSLPLLRHPAVARRWRQASALSNWSVAGLAGHFGRSIFNLQRAADRPPPSDIRLLDAVDYYTVDEPQPADSAIAERIRERGDEEAAGGPIQLAERFARSITDLESRYRLGQLPPAVTLFGSPMSLVECARTCLLELVVHADDLAVSVEAPAPSFDYDVFDLTAETLAQISVRRYGGLSVVRSFARTERAPTTIAVF